MLTINAQALDTTDELIIKKIIESRQIRLADLSRHVDLSIGALRWRVLDLSSRGLIRIERSRGRVTLYPGVAFAEAAE